MLAFAILLAAAAPAPNADLPRWHAQAARVTITRDSWGIAHVRGRSDADAVFGAIYAQAEDDFPRIERNYLTALGRQAEADGEGAIWDDLRHRLYLDEAELRAAYARSPAPMQRLMQAWADGLNHFLATHPEVKPNVLTRFEPWMALSFTEGSIGGDIERIDLDQLRRFYGEESPAIVAADPVPLKEPLGSNGFAIGPAKSATGNALLLINPHTSFYFRSELQMTSEEGLNAYGASTWGQFFIYQGFNQNIGWMHTSSVGADNVDEFAETIVRGPKGLGYRHGGTLRPVEQRIIRIRFRQPDGSLGTREFTTFRTHHGPIVRAEGDKWIATALMNRPVEALQQSWLRTKASDLASFQQVASTYRANSSNNTVFASRKGEIAFLFPQFMPRRNPALDYTKAVDGSDPSGDWNGLLPVDQLPAAINPRTGWVQNTNNWPWSAAGVNSIRAEAFPRYIETGEENPRGEHALMLLQQPRRFTRDSLLEAAFSPYLPAFAETIPPLLAAYEALPSSDPLKEKLREPIALLRAWDYRWGTGSEATSLAVFWGNEMSRGLPADARTAGKATDWYAAAPAPYKLNALSAAVDRLQRQFGRWRMTWGEINRFQRITSDIKPRFDDTQPSIPVGFVSGNYGSLAAYGSQPYPNTKRWYGNYGNSFVAVVEFGPRVSARAVTAGGVSGDPQSPHFADQAERYASGDFREVYFYPDQLKGHTKRVYRPGE
ncbi:penicillin acylase family protein [Sphingomonas sp.]|jgi:acyl-homoserine-lactone acylase|uniref:penicillin acylase family protein n=1 Tax=Sphingomonas sp. TaxID=28214 RepID=UPI002DF1CB1A|nr:penicillin acylase family protein [Sphingomonas sp.]HEV2568629.1 penicillin acylase family protein [Sphingomonas sp.]